MSAPVLYNYDLDEDCYRVRLVAACCGIDLALHNIDVFPGREQQQPAFLSLNPLGRLPVLDHDGLILRQTGAILLHVAGLDPARRFLPEDPATAARMTDWLIFAERELPVSAQARACSLLDAPGDLAALTARSRVLLQVMDDHMARQQVGGAGFFAGDAVSLADLALFPAFALSRDIGIDHDGFPALRRWARRVRQVDGAITMPGIPDPH